MNNLQIFKNEEFGEIRTVTIDGEPWFVGKDISETTKDMIAQMVDEDSELISVYYGEDTAAEDADALGAYLEETYPDCDVEVHSGGQPIYYYVLAVE